MGVDVGRSGAAGRREEILAIAADLFFERGYHATSMRQIAEVLGLWPGSLYHYFADKQAILFELIAWVLDQLTGGARALVAQEDRHPLKLAALVTNHVVLHAVRARGPVVGDSELRSLEGPRRARSLAARDEYLRLVVSVLRDGQRAGDFRLLDPDLTAYALIAQGSALGIWFREPGRLALEEVARTHVNLAMRAVGTPPLEMTDVRRLCEAALAIHRRPRSVDTGHAAV